MITSNVGPSEVALARASDTRNQPTTRNPQTAKESPETLRTRAFVASGEPFPAAAAQPSANTNGAQLLAHALPEMHKMLGDLSQARMPGAGALSLLAKDGERLAQQVASSAHTSPEFSGEEATQNVNSLLAKCQVRLGQAHPSDQPHLNSLRSSLRDVRLLQSKHRFSASPHAKIIPMMHALVDMDPAAFGAECKSRTGPNDLQPLSAFVLASKNQCVELANQLKNEAVHTPELFESGAAADLAAAASTVLSLSEKCTEPKLQKDLLALRSAISLLAIQVGKTEQALLEAEFTNIPLSPSGSTEHLVRPESRSDSAQKTSLTQTILKKTKGLGHKTDAYGAVSRMDDDELLAKMRNPSALLTDEQIEKFAALPLFELSDEQLAIVDRRTMPGTFDVEEGRNDRLKDALRSGELRLTDEQLDMIQAHPQVDPADTAMLDSLRSGNLADQLDAWIDHNAKLPAVLQKSGLPADAQKGLLKLNDKMNAELNTFKNGAAMLPRLLASPAMLLGLAPLPLAVSMFSGDKPYSASLIAHFTKNAVFMGGLMMNGMTNSRTNFDHLMNRYLVTELANAIVAIPTFQKNTALLEDVRFGLGAAVLSGGLTLAAFNRDGIRNVFAKVKAMISTQDHGDPNVPAVDAADHQAVAEHFDKLDRQQGQFDEAIKNFKADGDKEVSDVLNANRTALIDGATKAVASYKAADALRTNTELTVSKRDNPEFYPKMGLVVTTAGISAALVALLESLVGRADYAADGLWCTSEMLKIALNPDANMQDAVKIFKEIVGLNLVMTAFLGVNKGWDFLDKGAKGYLGGSAVLTAANLTIPGMVGGVAGKVVGNALEYSSNKISDQVQALKETERGKQVGNLLANMYQSIPKLKLGKVPMHTQPGLELTELPHGHSADGGIAPMTGVTIDPA